LTGLQEAIETLEELKRLHQLNYELLEQLSVTCKWMIENQIQSPNLPLLCSLLSRADSLLAEIKADSPKLLVYQKLSDEKKHPDDSDTGVTVPIAVTIEGSISSALRMESQGPGRCRRLYPRLHESNGFFAAKPQKQ